ncbi:ABC transporter permease [Crossiella cryophila]|uniref:Xylose transport system permease protein XylH n=1 Tax=Crossiella cryophila TaxID=43355 RepID=A0A7W7CF12_9PSEU|nr:ABC transporter permease [Crossiella cryophila]MBB4680022.1 simple sugar transport system permease protein [Crossiella cryophila]
MTRRPELRIGLGLLALGVFFTLVCGPDFLLRPQWLTLAAEIGVVAIPLTLLVIAGEFDLSAGSVLAAAGMTTAIAHGHFTTPLWAAALLALAVGALTGLLNGVLTVVTGLPSFLVTLVSLLLVAGGTLGLSRAITGSGGVSLRPAGPGTVEAVVLAWVLLALVAGRLLGHTPFGNWVLATGGDRTAARALGVPVTRVRITLFVATSTAAALIGVAQAIRFAGADVARGQGFLFVCLTAVVIGGAALSGGRGSVTGACLGSALCAVLSAGVVQAGWGSDWAPLLWGALLLAATAGQHGVRRSRSGRPW